MAVDDAAGNTAEEPIMLVIDRSAPEPPDRVQLRDYDAAAATVMLDWTEGDDPVLPDGEPASGPQYTDYRRRAADGTWGAWQRVEVGSDATLQNAHAGNAIAFELRSIDHVGNVSPVVATTLTPEPDSQPQAMATAADGFDSCTPRIHEGGYARARNSVPDYQRFTEVETTLGAQLDVFCIVNGSTDRVELWARFGYDTGRVDPDTGAKIFHEVGNGYFQRFTPRHFRDVKIRGLNAVCEPRMGGLKEYLVFGTLKYIRDDAVDVTHNYRTDQNHPVELSCPSAALRRARRTAGWHWLKRYSPQYLTDPSKRMRRRPSRWLRDELGSRPYNPPGTTPGTAWQAHQDAQAKLFNCGVHPNSQKNGIYLRARAVRRTNDDGTVNPRYTALRNHSPDLADRQYHGDTLRSVYVTRVKDALSGALADERCPIGGPLEPELSAFKDDLRAGTVDLGLPRN